MPHQFLLHTHRSVNQIEPGALRVSERVPPDVAETKLPSSRTNVVLLDWTRVITTAGDRAREHPPYL